MKKIFLIAIVTIFSLQLSNAQSSKVSTAYFLMDDYEQSKNVDDLYRAKKAIDEAAEHESTIAKGKTWYYRGLICNLLAEDETAKNDGNDYIAEALFSFKKSLSVEDKKFREDDKVVQLLKALAVNSFNDGVEAFKTKDFKKSFAKFNATLDVNKTIKENGSKEPVNSLTALEYAAISASNAGMNEDAISSYNSLIEKDKENNHYFNLAKLYKRTEQMDLYNKTLADGNKAFPDDANIIIAQLNVLINAGKTSEAMDKIDKAIELQPDNDMLYFVKGNTLENAGEIDQAIELYKKAAEINPKNDKALYNIGAVYFKKANALIEKMNALTMSAADTKKYEEYNAERKAIYTTAKPYFEKVLELKPNDTTSQRALNKINSTLGN